MRSCGWVDTTGHRGGVLSQQSIAREMGSLTLTVRDNRKFCFGAQLLVCGSDAESIMRELIGSALNLSWSMSLFGVEQFFNLLMINPVGPQDKAIMAFNKVTQAIVQQYNNFIQGTFQAGDELQRALVDEIVGFLSPTDDIEKLPRDTKRQLEALSRFVISGWSGLAALEELRNKIEVFILVPSVPLVLALPSKPPYPSLLKVAEKAYDLEPYPALWAVEGLGHWYGDTFWERQEVPQGILTDQRESHLPAKSLLMLHAGIGLSIAQHELKTVNHFSPLADIRQVVTRIVALCKENSRPGYGGAALESLGLVARSGTFSGDARPDLMVPIVGQVLSETNPDVLGYFWHGVGRAVYFLPINFVPCYGSIWHAVDMVRRESPDEFAWHNALAGLTWAVTMVNIRQPIVMADLLQYHGHQLAENPGFSYGIATSVMMRYDTTPQAPFITPFYQYRPDSNDPSLVQLWDSQVRQPTQEALQDKYPILKREQRLGEIFHYRNSDPLLSTCT